MPSFPYPNSVSDDQAEAIEQAAMLIIRARQEAGAMLGRSGLEPPPEQGWFGSPCGELLPPPPQNHRCFCRNYTGDGGPCRTQFRDFTGPDFGEAPLRTCGHRPSQHLET